MPRAAHHLAALDQLIVARHVGVGTADDIAATHRGALMRATIDQSVEGVVDVVDADLAARGADDLAAPRLNLACERNDVLRHQARPYNASALSRMIIRLSASGTCVLKA